MLALYNGTDLSQQQAERDAISGKSTGDKKGSLYGEPVLTRYHGTSLDVAIIIAESCIHEPVSLCFKKCCSA